MFKVVEFADGSGGGVGLVRDEWLTPRKKEAMWPSVKLSSQYNKCLLEGSIPDEKWKVHAIGRIFYSIDYDVIARHLALINNRLDDRECVLTELKTHVLPSMNSNTTCHLPSEIILPCQSTKEVEKVEEWLTACPDNQLTLENNPSLVGGKKLAKIVRQILEKVFTNSLAVRYNWTGKNNKIPLRYLKLPKVIIGAVRKNTQVQSATDVEILEVSTDWFRFAKDRDGGRAARG